MVKTFDIVQPLETLEADFTSDVLETPPAAYNAGTTYSEDDYVSVFSGVDNTTATIYRSKIDGNTGNTPDASPDEWEETSGAYLAWNSGTAYSAAGAVVTRDHRLFQSLQANTNKDPLVAANIGTQWFEIGPSNLWAAFDNLIDTPTVRYEKVTLTLDNNERFDTVSLLGLSGSSVNIHIEKQDATVLWDEDYSLVDYAGITDYYEHFFNPVRRRDTLTVRNLPLLAGLKLIVTIEAVAEFVSVGTLVRGQSEALGVLLYDPELTYIDYSDIAANEFGRRAVVIRDFKKQGDFSLRVYNAYWDYVFDLITKLRGTPCLLIADENYKILTFFGLITAARKNIPYKEYSTMRVRIEDF